MSSTKSVETKAASRDKPKQAPSNDALSPAMRQYVEQKKRVGDAILLFRMGDFYETFYEDAVLCAKVLGIALTSRNKNDDNPIPLAGIPYHALDGYLTKLVKAGYKVAISEQLEDPKQAKGVVKRDVVRIVTAGTLTEESLLAATDDNILAAIVLRERNVGLATVELASGRLELLDVARDSVLDHLVRLRPAELLIDDERGSDAERLSRELFDLCQTATTRRLAHEFLPYQAEKSLLEHFDVSTLAGFGFEGMNPSLCAAGCIIQYLQETQKAALSHITSIKRHSAAEFLQIDHNSWRALEIDRTLRAGQHEGTLVSAVDRTVHPIGGRKLRHWLRTPLIDRERIVARQDAVSWFADSEVIRGRARRHLRNMSDVERIAGRVALSRSSPRDLHALGQTLHALPTLLTDLSESRVPYLDRITDDLGGVTELADLLVRALRGDPPTTSREGGFIADGFDAELDRLHTISRDGQSWLADYQRKQIDATGIANLKVGFNRVFGYYIEVSNAARDKVPPGFVRKQTVKNAERYITDELKHFEEEALSAEQRANELEYRLFERLCDDVRQHLEKLMRVADAVGRLDCIAALAELAVQRRYVRPQLVDDTRLEIRDGRHPVLDQTLGDSFVPNDTAMDGDASRVFVITGPNMAGKSTYIRQVALITLLAQTGSFVPAAGMSFSIVDRIFARVGSSDEIMRGRSTFMVEMTEAANILHNATQRSLVVLDELGRGTSTFDGLSLAWAITEHLARDVTCRSLVATHYHELTELAELLQGVRNFNVAVRESAAAGQADGGIVFLHKIIEGGASQSYGIHVARLAGIPKPVIARSGEILEELQRGFERESHTSRISARRTKTDDQLMLFTDPAESLYQELTKLDPDQLTPLEALQRLQEWKERFHQT